MKKKQYIHPITTCVSFQFGAVMQQAISTDDDERAPQSGKSYNDFDDNDDISVRNLWED